MILDGVSDRATPVIQMVSGLSALLQKDDDQSLSARVSYVPHLILFFMTMQLALYIYIYMFWSYISLLLVGLKSILKFGPLLVCIHVSSY